MRAQSGENRGVKAAYYWRSTNTFQGFLAERGGFEPPIGLHLCRISSAVHRNIINGLCMVLAASGASFSGSLRGVRPVRLITVLKHLPLKILHLPGTHIAGILGFCQ